MIVLLPLRGWMGDAMATQMAAHAAMQAPAATEAPFGNASTPAELSADMPAGGMASHSMTGEALDEIASNCMGHNMQGSQDPPGKTENTCGSCSLCQACHTLALTNAGTAARLVFVDGTMPRAKSAQFASAEAALGQKPPIS